MWGRYITVSRVAMKKDRSILANLDESEAQSPAKFFGFIDWDSPSLLSDYYPQDLPKDWRLDYYANEYSVVVVPFSKWFGLSRAELEEWLEAGGDELFFLFETEKDTNEDSIAVLRQIFADQLLVLSPRDGVRADIVEKRVALIQNHNNCVFYIQQQNENTTYLKELRIALEGLLPGCLGANKLFFIVQGEGHLIETAESVQILLDLMA